MKARPNIPRRVLGTAERLEQRLALTATVLSALPDLTVPATDTSRTISVVGRFDDTAVTGTVARFSINAASPNDRVFVELFDKEGAGRTRTTPLTVANFLKYVDAGDYANTIIHRSVPGFVVQGGGFTAPTAPSNQAGGSPTTITTRPTVANEPGNTNVRGTIAMAKLGNDPDSATDQWFFNLADNSANLDNQNGGFTAFGRVLGSGMTAVDAMAAVKTYNLGGAFDQIPLRDVPNPVPGSYVVQPGQYVTLPSIRRVGELVYSVTSSNSNLVTASFLDDSAGTNLRLDYGVGQSGSAEIAVKATSVFDPTDFVVDTFTVVRDPPTGPQAPTGVVAQPGNGLVSLAWAAPASNGGAAITDYVVQYSGDGGSSWTTFADGTSSLTRAVVTGLTNGTSYVFRVAGVNAAGTGAASANSVAIAPRAVVAVGAEIGVGSSPVVQLVQASTGAVLAQVTAFEPAFRGGVRVALGDVDADGVPEVIVASGPGRVGEIRVFRQQVSGGTTLLAELPAYRTLPFGPGYTGGVEVAVGDVDGDGREDLVAAMSRGGGTVNVFRSVDAADPIQNAPYRTFTPFGRTFDGGATVAVADVGTFAAGRLTGATAADGRVEIVVGSGPGMRPTVLVYDVSGTPRVVTTIQPFITPAQGGVSVSSGRYDNDAIDDIVMSAGRGGGSAVRIFSVRLDQPAPVLLATSAAFASLARPNAAVFMAPVDLDGNGTIDRFAATQGDAGGSVGVLTVFANGTRGGALGSLRGPFRIAAPRTVRH